jgi:hypothetical protein
MQVTGIKKELQDLKKVIAPNYKTIEELLKIDPRYLTDEELFRLIQIDYPEFKSLEDLTTEILEKMVKGEYP